MSDWRVHARILGSAAGIASIALAWFVIFGDALQWIEVDSGAGYAYDPHLPASVSGLDHAKAVLDHYGGLPRDAVLTGAPDPRTPARGRSDYTWQPRDDVAWDDHIIVSLAGDDRSGLAVTWVRRQWRPWPVRAVTGAFDRWRTPLAPAPSSLKTVCRNVDMTALRRDLGSVLGADIPLHHMRRPYITWSEVVARLSSGHSVVAHWDRPPPTLRVAGSEMAFTDALFTDGAEYAIRLAPESLQGRPVRDWYWFASTLHDPVCPPRVRRTETKLSDGMQ